MHINSIYSGPLLFYHILFYEESVRQASSYKIKTIYSGRACLLFCNLAIVTSNIHWNSTSRLKKDWGGHNLSKAF